MLKRSPKRVSFQEEEEILALPNLIEVQIKSYHQFLQADKLPHERDNVRDPGSLHRNLSD